MIKLFGILAKNEQQMKGFLGGKVVDCDHAIAYRDTHSFGVIVGHFLVTKHVPVRSYGQSVQTAKLSNYIDIRSARLTTGLF